MKVAAPPTAIGRPTAAEVPTALRMTTLHQARKGTVRLPPPMPMIADRPPMTVPARLMPPQPGRPRWAAGLAPNHICAATTRAKIPNSARSESLRNWSATSPPMAVPTRIAGVSRATTGHSTAPRPWWARIEDSEVTTMVASEVPIARCMARSEDTPRPGIRWARPGTMMKPPPTPSNPAAIPVVAPTAR